ncbi:hypothetical protein ADUPG1_007791, partial [Aduncisulcus paluster]
MSSTLTIIFLAILTSAVIILPLYYLFNRIFVFRRFEMMDIVHKSAEKWRKKNRTMIIESSKKHPIHSRSPSRSYNSTSGMTSTALHSATTNTNSGHSISHNNFLKHRRSKSIPVSDDDVSSGRSISSKDLSSVTSHPDSYSNETMSSLHSDSIIGNSKKACRCKCCCCDDDMTQDAEYSVDASSSDLYDDMGVNQIMEMTYHGERTQKEERGKKKSNRKKDRKKKNKSDIDGKDSSHCCSCRRCCCKKEEQQLENAGKKAIDSIQSLIHSPAFPELFVDILGHVDFHNSWIEYSKLPTHVLVSISYALSQELLTLLHSLFLDPEIWGRSAFQMSSGDGTNSNPSNFSHSRIVDKVRVTICSLSTQIVENVLFRGDRYETILQRDEFEWHSQQQGKERLKKERAARIKKELRMREKQKKKEEKEMILGLFSELRERREQDTKKQKGTPLLSKPMMMGSDPQTRSQTDSSRQEKSGLDPRQQSSTEEFSSVSRHSISQDSIDDTDQQQDILINRFFDHLKELDTPNLVMVPGSPHAAPMGILRQPKSNESPKKKQNPNGSQNSELAKSAGGSDRDFSKIFYSDQPEWERISKWLRQESRKTSKRVTMRGSRMTWIPSDKMTIIRSLPYQSPPFSIDEFHDETVKAEEQGENSNLDDPDCEHISGTIEGYTASPFGLPSVTAVPMMTGIHRNNSFVAAGPHHIPSSRSARLPYASTIPLSSLPKEMSTSDKAIHMINKYQHPLRHFFPYLKRSLSLNTFSASSSTEHRSTICSSFSDGFWDSEAQRVRKEAFMHDIIHKYKGIHHLPALKLPSPFIDQGTDLIESLQPFLYDIAHDAAIDTILQLPNPESFLTNRHSLSSILWFFWCSVWRVKVMTESDGLLLNRGMQPFDVRETKYSVDNVLRLSTPFFFRRLATLFSVFSSHLRLVSLAKPQGILSSEKGMTANELNNNIANSHNYASYVTSVFMLNNALEDLTNLCSKLWDWFQDDEFGNESYAQSSGHPRGGAVWSDQTQGNNVFPIPRFSKSHVIFDMDKFSFVAHYVECDASCPQGVGAIIQPHVKFSERNMNLKRYYRKFKKVIDMFNFSTKVMKNFETAAMQGMKKSEIDKIFEKNPLAKALLKDHLFWDKGNIHYIHKDPIFDAFMSVFKINNVFQHMLKWIISFFFLVAGLCVVLFSWRFFDNLAQIESETSVFLAMQPSVYSVQGLSLASHFYNHYQDSVGVSTVLQAEDLFDRFKMNTQLGSYSFLSDPTQFVIFLNLFGRPLSSLNTHPALYFTSRHSYLFYDDFLQVLRQLAFQSAELKYPSQQVAVAHEIAFQQGWPSMLLNNSANITGQFEGSGKQKFYVASPLTKFVLDKYSSDIVDPFPDRSDDIKLDNERPSGDILQRGHVEQGSAFFVKNPDTQVLRRFAEESCGNVSRNKHDNPYSEWHVYDPLDPSKQMVEMCIQQPYYSVSSMFARLYSLNTTSDTLNDSDGSGVNDDSIQERWSRYGIDSDDEVELLYYSPTTFLAPRLLGTVLEERDMYEFSVLKEGSVVLQAIESFPEGTVNAVDYEHLATDEFLNRLSVYTSFDTDSIDTDAVHKIDKVKGHSFQGIQLKPIETDGYEYLFIALGAVNLLLNKDVSLFSEKLFESSLLENIPYKALHLTSDADPIFLFECYDQGLGDGEDDLCTNEYLSSIFPLSFAPVTLPFPFDWFSTSLLSLPAPVGAPSVASFLTKASFLTESYSLLNPDALNSISSAVYLEHNSHQPSVTQFTPPLLASLSMLSLDYILEFTDNLEMKYSQTHSLQISSLWSMDVILIICCLCGILAVIVVLLSVFVRKKAELCLLDVFCWYGETQRTSTNNRIRQADRIVRRRRRKWERENAEHNESQPRNEGRNSIPRLQRQMRNSKHPDLPNGGGFIPSIRSKFEQSDSSSPSHSLIQGSHHATIVRQEYPIAAQLPQPSAPAIGLTEAPSSISITSSITSVQPNTDISCSTDEDSSDFVDSANVSSRSEIVVGGSTEHSSVIDSPSGMFSSGTHTKRDNSVVLFSSPMLRNNRDNQTSGTKADDCSVKDVRTLSSLATQSSEVSGSDFEDSYTKEEFKEEEEEEHACTASSSIEIHQISSSSSSQNDEKVHPVVTAQEKKKGKHTEDEVAQGTAGEREKDDGEKDGCEEHSLKCRGVLFESNSSEGAVRPPVGKTIAEHGSKMSMLGLQSFSFSSSPSSTPADEAKKQVGSFFVPTHPFVITNSLHAHKYSESIGKSAIYIVLFFVVFAAMLCSIALFVLYHSRASPIVLGDAKGMTGDLSPLNNFTVRGIVGASEEMLVSMYGLYETIFGDDDGWEPSNSGGLGGGGLGGGGLGGLGGLSASSSGIFDEEDNISSGWSNVDDEAMTPISVAPNVFVIPIDDSEYSFNSYVNCNFFNECELPDVEMDDMPNLSAVYNPTATSPFPNFMITKSLESLLGIYSRDWQTSMSERVSTRHWVTQKYAYNEETEEHEAVNYDSVGWFKDAAISNFFPTHPTPRVLISKFFVSTLSQMICLEYPLMCEQTSIDATIDVMLEAIENEENLYETSGFVDEWLTFSSPSTLYAKYSFIHHSLTHERWQKEIPDRDFFDQRSWIYNDLIISHSELADDLWCDDRNTVLEQKWLELIESVRESDEGLKNDIVSHVRRTEQDAVILGAGLKRMYQTNVTCLIIFLISLLLFPVFLRIIMKKQRFRKLRTLPFCLLLLDVIPLLISVIAFVSTSRLSSRWNSAGIVLREKELGNYLASTSAGPMYLTTFLSSSLFYVAFGNDAPVSSILYELVNYISSTQNYIFSDVTIDDIDGLILQHLEIVSNDLCSLERRYTECMELFLNNKETMEFMNLLSDGITAGIGIVVNAAVAQTQWMFDLYSMVLAETNSNIEAASNLEELEYAWGQKNQFISAMKKLSYSASEYIDTRSAASLISFIYDSSNSLAVIKDIHGWTCALESWLKDYRHNAAYFDLSNVFDDSGLDVLKDVKEQLLYLYDEAYNWDTSQEIVEEEEEEEGEEETSEVMSEQASGDITSSSSSSSSFEESGKAMKDTSMNVLDGIIDFVGEGGTVSDAKNNMSRDSTSSSTTKSMIVISLEETEDDSEDEDNYISKKGMSRIEYFHDVFAEISQKLNQNVAFMFISLSVSVILCLTPKFFLLLLFFSPVFTHIRGKGDSQDGRIDEKSNLFSFLKNVDANYLLSAAIRYDNKKQRRDSRSSITKRSSITNTDGHGGLKPQYLHNLALHLQSNNSSSSYSYDMTGTFDPFHTITSMNGRKGRTQLQWLKDIVTQERSEWAREQENPPLGLTYRSSKFRRGETICTLIGMAIFLGLMIVICCFQPKLYKILTNESTTHIRNTLAFLPSLSRNVISCVADLQFFTQNGFEYEGSSCETEIQFFVDKFDDILHSFELPFFTISDDIAKCSQTISSDLTLYLDQHRRLLSLLRGNQEGERVDGKREYFGHIMVVYVGVFVTYFDRIRGIDSLSGCNIDKTLDVIHTLIQVHKKKSLCGNYLDWIDLGLQISIDKKDISSIQKYLTKMRHFVITWPEYKLSLAKCISALKKE